MTYNQTYLEPDEIEKALFKLITDVSKEAEAALDADGNYIRLPMRARTSLILALIKADRQNMIEKLAFHTGIPKEVLEGYLEAKD